MALPGMWYDTLIRVCISDSTGSVPKDALIVRAGKTKGADTLDREIP